MYVTGTSINKKDNIDVENKDIMNTEDYFNDLIRSSQNNLSKNINHNNNFKNVNLTFLGIGIQNFKSLDIADANCLEKQIARAYKKNELVQAIITAKVDSL